MVKDDQGTLVLSGNNLYTGGTEVRAGTLQVSGDANLGDVAGGITMSGGTLAATASFDTRRAVTLTRNGQFNVAAGATLGLSGLVSGAADLIKLGAGTLCAARAMPTATRWCRPALIGNAVTISGNIGNAATTVFDQSADANYAGNIGALGGVSGAMVKQGAGNLTLAGNSALNWSVQAGTLTSAAERFSGNASIAAGAALAFNQIADAAYGGTLSGAGAFIKTGAGTLAYNGDSSGYTGTTSISSGTLLIGRQRQCQRRARRRGHGAERRHAGRPWRVGQRRRDRPDGGFGRHGLARQCRHRHADGQGQPGLQRRRALQRADRSDRQRRRSDPCHRHGGPGRRVGRADRPGGQLRAALDLQILSADDGLSGTFGSVTSNFAFLDPKLTYDANNAYLTLTRNNISFTSNGLTPNQNAAAGAVDSIGGGQQSAMTR